MNQQLIKKAFKEVFDLNLILTLFTVGLYAICKITGLIQ